MNERPFRPRHGDRVFVLWSNGTPHEERLPAWNPVTREEFDYELPQWVIFPDRATARRFKEQHTQVADLEIREYTYSLRPAGPDETGSVH